MATVKFTNPTDMPVYADWGFDVLGAEIVLSADDLLRVYTTYIENHRHVFSNISQNTPRYAEAQRLAELCVVLKEAIAANDDIGLDGDDYVWAFVSDLLFEKRFISAHCPACDLTFSAKECSVLKWAYGESLAAYGGRRVLCPSGHTLYSCGEWNS